MRTSDHTAAPAAISPPGSTARSRRNPRLVVLGLLCAIVGALGITAVVNQFNESSTVVAMARTVERGAVVSAADLTTVTVGPVPGIATVASADLNSLVGQTALVDLPSGSLVAQSSVGEPVVESGSAQLGLKLAAGRLPTTPMPAGTTVQLIPVAGAAEGQQPSSAPIGDPITAVIRKAPTPLADGSHWLVDVSVPDNEAARVAALAAADRLVMARTS